MSSKEEQSKNDKKAQRSERKRTEKVSKERLNRISHTRAHHFRTNHRVMKYGVKSFVRNSWLSLAAIAIMSITLIVLGSTIVAMNVLNSTIDTIEAQVELSIYIKQGASASDVEKMLNGLSELPSVTSVRSTSPEAANVATIKEIIETNHITDEAQIKALYEAPNKIPWTINVKVEDIGDTSELENYVNDDVLISNMLDAKPPSYTTSQRETIDNIANIINKVQIFGLGAAAVFAFISILIVFSTIRMAIFNRKEEIYMMTLVGASRWFIVGPFVIEASMYGVVSAIIAGAAIYAGLYALNSSLASTFGSAFALVNQYWYLAAAGLLVTGVLIGIFSSLLAIRKYLKTK